MRDIYVDASHSARERLERLWLYKGAIFVFEPPGT